MTSSQEGNQLIVVFKVMTSRLLFDYVSQTVDDLSLPFILLIS